MRCHSQERVNVQCSQFARSEQGQYVVQVASLTVNKWSNLGRSHSVTFGVNLCSKNIESFFLCPVYDGKCIAMSRKMMDSDINHGNLESAYHSTALFQLFPSEKGLSGQNLRLFS